MRLFLMVICLVLFHQGHCQPDQPNGWKNFVKSSDIHLKTITAAKNVAYTSVDTLMQIVISEADETFSLSELTTVVNICSEYCNGSTGIALSLVKLLREDHSIYINKLPTEVNQFRAFLLASLSKFPPNEEIYKYVKSELLFADHAINIAAAAVTARNYPGRVAELVPLMEPFLNSSFTDEWVDITTPELNYPIAHPTRARYEIISTLAAYGASAYRSVGLLDEIAACNTCRDYGFDSLLYKRAQSTAGYIRKVTPLCCQKETAVKSGHHNLMLIDKQKRKIISASNVKMVDQDGDSLKFMDLTAKPFVLTFFYTQCTNASKCISTVHRLGELETECTKDGMSGKIGIYGMTYDPDFDTPPILKKYGTMYGVDFNEDLKFLSTSNSEKTFFNQLQLRVNYGAGTVNQHGIQLFVFDKEGRLAAVCDNDSWSVEEVKNCLLRLVNE